jgi:hypothetical protein
MHFDIKARIGASLEALEAHAFELAVTGGRLCLTRPTGLGSRPMLSSWLLQGQYVKSCVKKERLSQASKSV